MSEDIKEAPSNNEEVKTEMKKVQEPQAEVPAGEPQGPGNPSAPAQGPEKEPDHFVISTDGVNDLVQAMNEVIASKFVKQVLFNVVNEHFKPVFKD